MYGQFNGHKTRIIKMQRREFFKGAVYTSFLATFPLSKALAETSNDHPNIINVIPNGMSLSLPLQSAFQMAFDLWDSDPFKRRPVIKLPVGEFVIDEITNNNRGNYPFRLPPTFKLEGKGKGQTIIRSAQPHGTQYRFLMTRPESRIDIIDLCPTLESSCVNVALSQQGPLNNSEIKGISFVDFDNAISLVDTVDVTVADCYFQGSLVAVQLVRGNQYGNKRARFVNCDFNSQRTNGDKQRFCLRFETPFYANWFTQVNSVPSEAECQNLGTGAVNYYENTQECEVVDDQKVISYLEELFGDNYDSDISNSYCVISNCKFSQVRCSAIEFAGTLNTYNTVQLSSFDQCAGTAIEFDKGASFNIAYRNTISGMLPTTVFAPNVPYVFQAAIQEQEGSYTANKQLKDVIDAYGFADPTNANFKGIDIFERAALLPVGNQITENNFDVARSYLLQDYESNIDIQAILPDTYPSIKLSKPNRTKVVGNTEFIGGAGNIIADGSVMGQSIIVYPDDTLRNNNGNIEIAGNKMHGGFFIISENDEINFNAPCLIVDNEFGNPAFASRSGLVISGCIAQSLEFRNNKFYCSEDSSSISLKKLSVETLTFDNNEFYLQAANSFYLRCLNADIDKIRSINFTNNVIEGGNAMTFYDWTTPNTASSDILNFNNNHIKNLTSNTKVVGVTLWFKNLTVADNHFDSLEDKTFQFYGLSDSLNYLPENNLTLGANSQSRAYSRNYSNTAGNYITNSFWQS
jgi:hypothetical protein